MALPSVLRWRDWPGESLEHVVVCPTLEGIRFESVLEEGPHKGAAYCLKLDHTWRVLELAAMIPGTAPLMLGWRDLLGGELYVDLAVTPLTNTLPIRRLGLPVGGSAEISVTYVDYPSLRVSLERQRYTRVAEAVYRFESLDGGFTRDLTVDDEGFVVLYPGLFRRVD